MTNQFLCFIAAKLNWAFLLFPYFAVLPARVKFTSRKFHTKNRLVLVYPLYKPLFITFRELNVTQTPRLLEGNVEHNFPMVLIDIRTVKSG